MGLLSFLTASLEISTCVGHRMGHEKKAKGSKKKSLKDLVEALNDLYDVNFDCDDPNVVSEILRKWDISTSPVPLYSGGPGVVGLICEELCRRLVKRSTDDWDIQHTNRDSVVKITRNYSRSFDISVEISAMAIEVGSGTLDAYILARRKVSCGKRLFEKFGENTNRMFSLTNPRLLNAVCGYFRELDEAARYL